MQTLAKIPKEFMLFGTKISVKYDNGLYYNNDATGESRYPVNEIVLQSTNDDYKADDSTFYHELVHWVLHMMGEEELDSNEKFVDIFGRLLHQFITTSKYQEEVK